MKIYKERQYLVFDFEDGKNVKYDFARQICIGKKGKEVTGLCSQLKGITMDDVIANCIDVQYAKFLRFVQDTYCKRERKIENIGTVLSKVPQYARYKQIFSAGFEDICGNDFTMTINDIPKGIVKMCRNHSIKLSNNLCKFYKENPDAYNTAWKLEYISLTDEDIVSLLQTSKQEKVFYGTHIWEYKWETFGLFNRLIKEFGYNAKSLLLYLDNLKTYEALDNVSSIASELYDYVHMMKQISNKFDKFPKHFLTTHRIAIRNYNRLIKEFEEKKFTDRIDREMEHTFGDYKFIYPSSTQDIKDEAVSQNNCVASYIDRVINGQCHILFLRKKDAPNQSLVTIEVRNGKIVQALQKFNHPLTKEQQEVVDKWNLLQEKRKKQKEYQSE